MKSQTEANKRWQKKNKEYSKYLSDRSRCRSFIKNISTDEDLEELIVLIQQRQELLLQLKSKMKNEKREEEGD